MFNVWSYFLNWIFLNFISGHETLMLSLYLIEICITNLYWYYFIYFSSLIIFTIERDQIFGTIFCDIEVNDNSTLEDMKKSVFLCSKTIKCHRLANCVNYLIRW